MLADFDVCARSAAVRVCVCVCARERYRAHEMWNPLCTHTLGRRVQHMTKEAEGVVCDLIVAVGVASVVVWSYIAGNKVF